MEIETYPTCSTGFVSPPNWRERGLASVRVVRLRCLIGNGFNEKGVEFVGGLRMINGLGRNTVMLAPNPTFERP